MTRPTLTPVADSDAQGLGREQGLTTDEVAQRQLRGEVNAVPTGTSRTVLSILASNLFTRFNVLLGALLVAILVIGPLQDALFGLVLLVNTPIGIAQELRAKWTLDRLRVLTTPTARVIRDGAAQEIPAPTLVVGDLIDLRTGDQVPVDGRVTRGSGLEIDEALVTGESAPVEKREGDDVLSGSFVVAGSGLIRSTKVGLAAYGNALAAEARRFAPVRSEVRRGIDRMLLMIAILMVPFGAGLIASQVEASSTPDEAVRSSVAGLVTMIPEGLVLLTSVVFAIAAVRFAQRGLIAQELDSVEMLARADVVCLDKTGTLTDGQLSVASVVHLGPEESSVVAALGALAAVDPHPNSTLAALALAFPAPGDWRPTTFVPFSSGRKWSGADFAGRGSWVLGAPEMLALAPGLSEVRQQADRLAATGNRVLLIGRLGSLPSIDEAMTAVEPLALVLLQERLRPDASRILSYYREQGVAVKVLSGDHPGTVAALAASAGMQGAGDPLSGADLPGDAAELGLVAERTAVFGRLSPQQKRDLVGALQARGHVVAMAGDGVNDVLALKAADVSVAMGSGSAAARAVARLTLVHDSFASVPFAIGEGRRVIANLERVATFFLTKSVYAMVLAAAVALRAMPFPLLPRQLSLVGLLAIGVPAFALSFAPGAERARSGFVSRTLTFAIPAGVVAGIASYVAFEIAIAAGSSIDASRTVATVVLLCIGLWIVGTVARPVGWWRFGLLAAMGAGAVLAFTLRVGRFVYGLALLDSREWLEALAITALAVLVLTVALRISARLAVTLGRRARAMQASRP
ncbi:MAG TPA: HAD-IC family P-type ATPase [Candidatus Acidoferrales bacterium]|nr:HAD-IC family P-type ATPase [Candidatus Acidoferrales bacterium]